MRTSQLGVSRNRTSTERCIYSQFVSPLFLLSFFALSLLFCSHSFFALTSFCSHFLLLSLLFALPFFFHPLFPSFFTSFFCWDSLIFHVSTMSSRTRDTRPNHTTTGLALWSSLTLETRSHPWVPAGHPQYTGAWFAREAVDGPSQHHRRQATHCARLQRTLTREPGRVEL